jgi:hypothetical protein
MNEPGLSSIGLLPFLFWNQAKATPYSDTRTLAKAMACAGASSSVLRLESVLTCLQAARDAHTACQPNGKT